MKKLLLIAILMLALVFTVVACTETPAGSDTTAADTTAETPTEAPTEDATTEEPTEEATTEEPTEEATTEEPTEEATTEEPTEEVTTEEPTEEATTADPADPVWIADPDAIAGVKGAGTTAYIADAVVMEEGGYKFVRITVNGGDSQFVVAKDLGTMPNYLAISYRANADKDGEMFIGTANGPNGQNDHHVLGWNQDNSWNLMIVDLSTIANVTDGNIGYFRLDPFRDTTDGNIDIEYIALFNTAEYAMAYNFELHKAPMWNETKAVISHQSFDELDKYADGAKVEGVFTPGQSAGWDMVVTLDDFSVDAIRYWGWIAGVTEQGLFGYQINGGPAIYDEAWTHPEDLMAHAPAGSTYTTRMKVMISLEGLLGENTIRVLYKDAAGTEVCLNEFTVALPARAPFEVPEHTDETIVLGTRVNGGPFSNTKNFGQRFTVAEGFLKNITITNMATYADGNTNKWNVTIWAWNTDYATTISGEPLYTVNGENHNDNQHFILDVPADLGIMGDIYYEITYLEGSAQFTGWIADGGVAEGVEAYIAGNLAEGTYASSIIVGIPTVEDPDAPVDPETPAVENLVIDMSTLGGTGYRAEFGAAGYNAPLQVLGYGVAIDLGEIDLSKYSAVKITYGCDGGTGTEANFAAASSLAIGLKSTNTSYGQETADNFDGDIAHTDMVFSSNGWASGAREAVVDLTNVDYNGNVWVAVHNPAGTEIAISAIEFIA